MTIRIFSIDLRLYQNNRAVGTYILYRLQLAKENIAENSKKKLHKVGHYTI